MVLMLLHYANSHVDVEFELKAGLATLLSLVITNAQMLFHFLSTIAHSKVACRGWLVGRICL